MKLKIIASFSKTITDADVQAFCGITGDFNPIHVNEVYARASRFKARIVHGMIMGGFISSVIANQLPGPGTIYLEQNMRFKLPVFIGDTITAIVELIELNREKGIFKLNTYCINQDDKIVIEGEAVVMNKENVQKYI